MLSKVTLASLFVAAAFAAPPPYTNDGLTPPIIQLKSSVSCTNVNPPNIAPTPSPSVILLNEPSPPQPSASNAYAGYVGAPAEPSGAPPIINLNNPVASPSPSVIKLNRRQFSSTSATSTFSFGGIVPSTSLPLLFPGTSTTSSSSSSSFSSSNIPTSPPAPTELPNGISAFTSTGADGIQTVFLLSTVTVIDSACTSSSVLNPSLTSSSFPALSSPTPTVSFSQPSVPAAVAQPPVNSPVSSPSIIILNVADSPTPFSVVPSSTTPTPFPTQAYPS